MNRNAPRVRTVSICIWILVLILATGALDPAVSQITQRIEIPSSPNPVGSGARALGMGGAFIAVADDATAASWNPGGLIQLEAPEVSVVGAGFCRSEDNTFSLHPEASGKESASEARLNYLSISYPFTVLNCNMVVSLNYQNLYDFTRDWQFPFKQSEGILSINENINYEQEGSLSALGLAYAIQITPQISFGFTLNFWGDSLYENQWEQTVHESGSGTLGMNPMNYESNSEDKYGFQGFNANLGILWHATSKFTVGAVFKTPFSADLKHEFSSDYSVKFPLDPEHNYSHQTPLTTEDERLDMPMSYGIGLAYRFSDQLTFSADIYRTEWDDFILTDSKGGKTSPITGLSESRSDVDATHQVRIGTEYLFLNEGYVVPLRGGVFYDPAPAQGSPDNYFGFSLGSGIAYKKVVFDVAYQYRFGNDVGTSILKDWGFSQDVSEHTLYASVIFHF